MRRILVILATLLVASFLTAPAANAASPHFKKGGSPTCTTTTNGSTSSSTVCKASLAGLGNGDLVVKVTVEGYAVYQCQNAGGNIAPGQNKVLTGPTTTPTTIRGDQIKNGNVSFTTNPAMLTAKPTVSAAEAGCPNKNWTGVNPTLTTTKVTMTISQGGVLLFTCGAANTQTGLTGTYNLKC